jgi:hypothetical protein
MSDTSIRYQWLGLLAWSTFLSLLTSFMTLRNEPTVSLNPSILYGVIGLILVSTFGISYLLYHCVYKKPGTKLLIFSLILSALCLLTTPVLIFTGKLQAPAYFPYYGAYTLITQLVGIWGFVISWKMLKINRRLKAATK